MIRKLDCSFVFEWETPVVCPDKVKTSGCSVTDEQLHYTFNLTSLSGRSFEVIHSGGVTFLFFFFFKLPIAINILKLKQGFLLSILGCERRLKHVLQLWSVLISPLSEAKQIILEGIILGF